MLSHRHSQVESGGHLNSKGFSPPGQLSYGHLGPRKERLLPFSVAWPPGQPPPHPYQHSQQQPSPSLNACTGQFKNCQQPLVTLLGTRADPRRQQCHQLRRTDPPGSPLLWLLQRLGCFGTFAKETSTTEAGFVPAGAICFPRRQTATWEVTGLTALASCSEPTQTARLVLCGPVQGWLRWP